MHDVNHFINIHQPLVDIALLRDRAAGREALSAHWRLEKEAIYPSSSDIKKGRKRPGVVISAVRSMIHPLGGIYAINGQLGNILVRSCNDHRSHGSLGRK
jgi:hypothetical protein